METMITSMTELSNLIIVLTSGDARIGLCDQGSGIMMPQIAGKLQPSIIWRLRLFSHSSQTSGSRHHLYCVLKTPEYALYRINLLAFGIILHSCRNQSMASLKFAFQMWKSWLLDMETDNHNSTVAKSWIYSFSVMTKVWGMVTLKAMMLLLSHRKDMKNQTTLWNSPIFLPFLCMLKHHFIHPLTTHHSCNCSPLLEQHRK